MSQQIIARLSHHQLHMKWMCIVSVLVFIALEVNWLGLVTVYSYWVLDAYYLKLERSFRNSDRSWFKAMFSMSTGFYYVALTVLIIGTSLV